MNFSVIYNAMIKEAKGNAQKTVKLGEKAIKLLDGAEDLLKKVKSGAITGFSPQSLEKQIARVKAGDTGSAFDALAKAVQKAKNTAQSVAPTKGAVGAAKNTAEMLPSVVSKTRGRPNTAKTPDVINMGTSNTRPAGIPTGNKDIPANMLQDLLNGKTNKAPLEYPITVAGTSTAGGNAGGAAGAGTKRKPVDFDNLKDVTPKAKKDWRGPVGAGLAATGTAAAGFGIGAGLAGSGSDDSSNSSLGTSGGEVGNGGAQKETKSKGIVDTAKDYAKQYKPELIGAGAGLAGAGGLYALGGAIPALKKKKLLRAMTALAGGAGIGYGAYALSQPKTASYKEFKNSIKRG